jgi:hypothetical protein
VCFDIGRFGSNTEPRSELEKPERLCTHRLRHTAGLAVGPDDAAIVEVDPRPFELKDLRHPRCELELESDRENDEGMLQAFDLSALKILKEPP